MKNQFTMEKMFVILLVVLALQSLVFGVWIIHQSTINRLQNQFNDGVLRFNAGTLQEFRLIEQGNGN